MNDERDPMEITNPDDVVSELTPPDPLPGFAPPPVVVVHQPPPPPPPARGRGGKGQAEPKPTKLQQTLPSPEKVKVERRRSDGHKTYIGTYSLEEIKRYGSWEIFLQNVVVPKWKGGEYELTYIRADGQADPNARVIIMDEPPSEPAGQVAPLDQVVRLAKQLQEDAARSQPAPVDPIQQMQQLLALQKQLGAGSEGGGMMQMLLMMQMMQPKEPPRDPMAETLRMVEAMKALQPPPAPLPMMPMPSGPDPTLTMMLEMMKMNADQTRAMVESLRHQDKPGPSLSEILHLSQSMTPKDGIGARDILPMISTMKDLVRPPEKDGLREHLEAFRLMRQELKELSDDSRPSGFQELAASVLPKGVESITELIQAIRSKEAATAQGLAGPMQAQQPPQSQMPQLPPGFQEHAKAINLSKDPVEAMGATLTAFLYLGQSPSFVAALETLVRHARGGEKDKALDLIQGFLEGIGQRGLITHQAAQYAMDGFDEHWDEVVTHLLGGQAPPKAPPKPKPQPPQPRRGGVVGHPPDAQVIPIAPQPIQPVPGQPIVPPPGSDGTGTPS